MPGPLGLLCSQSRSKLPSWPMIPPALKRVPPGAIGHNRAVVRRNYAFIPPEGVLMSRLPQYAGTVARFLAAPSLGARFAQVVLEIEPGGGTPEPVTDDVQHFFYVLSGTATLAWEGRRHAMPAGGYAYLPPDTPFTVQAEHGPARVLALRKRWQPAPGAGAPTAVHWAARRFETDQPHRVPG